METDSHWLTVSLLFYILILFLPNPHTPLYQIAQQLTLDVEQYLSDNMPYYPWADQVLSFSNYDIQILDVCPDTNSVVALLCVLLQTAKASKPVGNGDFYRQWECGGGWGRLTRPMRYASHFTKRLKLPFIAIFNPHFLHSCHYHSRRMRGRPAGRIHFLARHPYDPLLPVYLNPVGEPGLVYFGACLLFMFNSRFISCLTINLDHQYKSKFSEYYD